MALVKVTSRLAGGCTRAVGGWTRCLATRGLQTATTNNSHHHDPIVFSQNYEDIASIRAVFGLEAGSRVLTIASCGANAMTLLLDDPAHVTAVDMSYPQLALAKLQATGVRHLTHADFCSFVGVDRYNVPADERERIYRDIKGALEAEIQQYWDQRVDTIKDGLLYSGTFDYQMGQHVDMRVALVHDRDTIDHFLSLGDDLEAQVHYYEEEWKTWRWLQAFKHYANDFYDIFSDGAFPFNHPEWFKLLTKELETVIHNQPNNRNPYMELFLLGNITGKRGLREYLIKENFDVIKSRLDRMEWVHSEMGQYLQGYNAGKYDAVCLSNISDWLTGEEHDAIIAGTVGVTRPGGVIVYWNLTGVPKPWPQPLTATSLRIEHDVSHKAMLLNRFPWWEPICVATVL